MQGNPPLLEGVRSKTVQTPRLRTHLLESGPEEGIPVLMIHGNVSSSRFFEETLAAFPQGFRGLAPDLRGFGDSEVAPVDATRGLRDFSDDLFALVESLGLRGARLHLAGWSTGGAIALQYTMDHPREVASITLIDPMSPYGFGGTKDESGTPCWPDFAGSGGGTANPEFVRRLSEGDRTDEDESSPRNVLRRFYFRPTFEPEREEVYLSSMLSTATGEDNYPGDLTTSPNWPGLAPGGRGVNNAISPRYCDLSGFAGIEPKPPVLWVRGADDEIVSDESLLDFGTLGRLGAVPDWPGEEVYPPQPMVSQMRALLRDYAAGGGSFREEVIEDCGHSPHVEKPGAFRDLFFGFITR